MKMIKSRGIADLYCTPRFKGIDVFILRENSTTSLLAIVVNYSLGLPDKEKKKENAMENNCLLQSPY